MTPQLCLGQGFEVTPGFFRHWGVQGGSGQHIPSQEAAGARFTCSITWRRAFVLWLQALSEGRLAVFVQLPTSLL